MAKKESPQMFAFQTRVEAEKFRDNIRGLRSWRNGALEVRADYGAVLTAHVVGPNRPGVQLDYPFAVAVGSRRWP